MNSVHTIKLYVSCSLMLLVVGTDVNNDVEMLLNFAPGDILVGSSMLQGEQLITKSIALIRLTALAASWFI